MHAHRTRCSHELKVQKHFHKNTTYRKSPGKTQDDVSMHSVHTYQDRGKNHSYTFTAAHADTHTYTRVNAHHQHDQIM